MKMNLRLVVLCLALLGLLIHATGCVHVENPPDSGVKEQVEVLGGSDGYVLLRHENGKIYVVELASHSANEVVGLPQEKKTEMVVY